MATLILRRPFRMPVVRPLLPTIGGMSLWRSAILALIESSEDRDQTLVLSLSLWRNGARRCHNKDQREETVFGFRRVCPWRMLWRIDTGGAGKSQ